MVARNNAACQGDAILYMLRKLCRFVYFDVDVDVVGA